MTIKTAIIHRIRKAPNSIASFTGSTQCLDEKDDLVIDLIKQLDDSYVNRQKFVYGTFHEEEETTFQTKFLDYVDKPTKDNFVDFSRRASMNLKTIISGIGNAKGGYLVFAHYIKGATTFVGIFLVRDTKGISFRKDPAADLFTPKKRIHIDLEKIAMVCRINLTQFEKKSGNYLSFSNRRDSVSTYFLNWIAVTDQQNNETETRNLYSLIGKIALPNGETSKTEFYKKIATHIQNGKYEVDIRDLSKQFYGKKDYLLEQAESLDISISPAFLAHRPTLGRFTRIRAAADNIELIFPRGSFDDKTVSFSKGDKNLILIESKALADKIRGELSDSDNYNG